MQELVPFSNITLPFPWTIWLYILLVLTLFSVIFLLFHKSYYALGLTNPEPSVSNFLIYTFCKITEPEPLPWFERSVGGKLGVFSWSVFCSFIIMFYQSNLRANMITVTYSKPIETLSDIVDHGKTVWLSRLATTQR